MLSCSRGISGENFRFVVDDIKRNSIQSMELFEPQLATTGIDWQSKHESPTMAMAPE
jgi:hypothetical protein